MNIVEAVSKAVQSKLAIMNCERSEWLIVSNGILKWKKNRQTVTLTPKDILSTSWICEDDILTISAIQIQSAITYLTVEIGFNGKPEIKNIDGFIDNLVMVSRMNKGDV